MKTIYYIVGLLLLFITIEAQRQSKTNSETTTQKIFTSRGKTKFSLTPEYAEASNPKDPETKPLKSSERPKPSSRRTEHESRRNTERPYEVKEVIDDVPREHEYKYSRRVTDSTLRQASAVASEKVQQQNVRGRKPTQVPESKPTRSRVVVTRRRPSEEQTTVKPEEKRGKSRSRTRAPNTEIVSTETNEIRKNKKASALTENTSQRVIEVHENESEQITEPKLYSYSSRSNEVSSPSPDFQKRGPPMLPGDLETNKKTVSIDDPFVFNNNRRSDAFVENESFPTVIDNIEVLPLMTMELKKSEEFTTEIPVTEKVTQSPRRASRRNEVRNINDQITLAVTEKSSRRNGRRFETSRRSANADTLTSESRIISTSVEPTRKTASRRSADADTASSGRSESIQRRNEVPLRSSNIDTVPSESQISSRRVDPSKRTTSQRNVESETESTEIRRSEFSQRRNVASRRSSSGDTDFVESNYPERIHQRTTITEIPEEYTTIQTFTSRSAGRTTRSTIKPREPSGRNSTRKYEPREKSKENTPRTALRGRRPTQKNYNEVTESTRNGTTTSRTTAYRRRTPSSRKPSSSSEEETQKNASKELLEVSVSTERGRARGASRHREVKPEKTKKEEEIAESDNYPEPFKALLQKRAKLKNRNVIRSTTTTTTTEELNNDIESATIPTTVRSLRRLPNRVQQNEGVTESFVLPPSNNLKRPTLPTKRYTPRSTNDVDNNVTPGYVYHNRFKTLTEKKIISSTQNPKLEAISSSSSTASSVSSTVSPSNSKLPNTVPKVRTYSPKPPRGIYSSKKSASSSNVPVEIVPSSTVGYRKLQTQKGDDGFTSTTSISAVAVKPSSQQKFSSRYRNELLRATNFKTSSTPPYVPTVPVVTSSTTTPYTNINKMSDDDEIEIITLAASVSSTLYSDNLISELLLANLTSSEKSFSDILFPDVTTASSNVSTSENPSTAATVTSTMAALTTTSTSTTQRPETTTSTTQRPTATTTTTRKPETTSTTTTKRPETTTTTRRPETITTTTTKRPETTTTEQPEITTPQLTLTTGSTAKTTFKTTRLFPVSTVSPRSIAFTTPTLVFNSPIQTKPTVPSSSSPKPTSTSLFPFISRLFNNIRSPPTTNKPFVSGTTSTSSTRQSSTIAPFTNAPITSTKTQAVSISSPALVSLSVAPFPLTDNTDDSVTAGSLTINIPIPYVKSNEISPNTSSSSTVAPFTSGTTTNNDINVSINEIVPSTPNTNILSLTTTTTTTASPRNTATISNAVTTPTYPTTTSNQASVTTVPTLPPIPFMTTPAPTPFVTLSPIPFTTQSYNPRFAINRPAIDTTASSATAKPKRDYVVFGILPNNTVVRRNPNTTPENTYIIYGVYPNNTVVRKYPNGTIVPDDTVEIPGLTPATLKYNLATNNIARFLNNEITKPATTTSDLRQINNSTTDNSIKTQTTSTTVATPLTSSTPSAIITTTSTEAVSLAGILGSKTVEALNTILNETVPTSTTSTTTSTASSKAQVPAIQTLDVDLLTNQIRLDKSQGSSALNAIPSVKGTFASSTERTITTIIMPSASSLRPVKMSSPGPFTASTSSTSTTTTTQSPFTVTPQPQSTTTTTKRPSSTDRQQTSTSRQPSSTARQPSSTARQPSTTARQQSSTARQQSSTVGKDNVGSTANQVPVTTPSSFRVQPTVPQRSSTIQVIPKKTSKLTPEEERQYLADLAFLNNLRQATAGITTRPRKEQEELANRIIALAVGRTSTTPGPTSSTTTTSTTTTTTRPRVSASSTSFNLLPPSSSNKSKNQAPSAADVSDEELLKYLNQLGIRSTTRQTPISTTYGMSSDALLAALLKEQGIGPSLPGQTSNLQQQLQLAALLDQIIVTPKPKPKTTRRTTTTPRPAPPRPIIDGFRNWIFNAFNQASAYPGPAPAQTTRKPRPKTTTTQKAKASQSQAIEIATGDNSVALESATKVTKKTPSQTPRTRPRVTSTIDPFSSQEEGDGMNESQRQTRGQLVDAAINVTKAFSQFLGAAIQGAANSFQSFLNSGTRSVSDYFSFGSVAGG